MMEKNPGKTYEIFECGVNDYPFTVTEDNTEINAFATRAEAEKFIVEMQG